MGEGLKKGKGGGAEEGGKGREGSYRWGENIIEVRPSCLTCATNEDKFSKIDTEQIPLETRAQRTAF